MRKDAHFSLPLAAFCVLTLLFTIGTAPVKRADARSHASSTRWFSPTSFWNAPLPADAPLDADSDKYVRTLLGLVQADQNAHRGPWINTDGYSTPIYTVPAGQPTVRVTLDTDYPPLQRAFTSVPIPKDARPAAGTDSQMTVWQPATDTLWEFWAMRKANGEWHARWGGRMQHVSTSPGYYRNVRGAGGEVEEEASWGATATSLPLVGGLMTIKELQAGHIPHALQVVLPSARTGEHSWPAQRTDGRSSDPAAIPEGARFRLDPKLDLNSLHLPPLMRAMAEAVQRYGMVVNDTTNYNISFRAEDPTPLIRAGHANPYDTVYRWQMLGGEFAQFPWSHLQLLKMQIDPEGKYHP